MKGVFLAADFKSSVADWLMWMAVFAQVNFTLEIYSKIKISGNVCRKRRKQMGQETFQWSVLFLPVSHKWDPSTAIDLLIVKPCW